MILTVKNIEKSFGGVKALDDVNLDIEKRSITGLIGPNGSGKTTLINIISGFMAPDSGIIRFDNKDISSLRPHEIAGLGVCRTFQFTRIFRRMTVHECMLLSSKAQDANLSGIFLNSKRNLTIVRKDTEKARLILESLEIGHLMNEYAGVLSIGQRKLLSLGMVLMACPRLVLLDEPVAGVNPGLAQKIFDRIQQEKERTTFVIIEHNVDILMKFCDNIFVMNKGKIVASGKPEEIQYNENVIDAYLGG